MAAAGPFASMMTPMPPSSSARRHLDFQRLLVATEAAAEAHGRTGAADAQDRQYQLELNRLLVFVRALREQLTELYGLADYNLTLGNNRPGGGGLDASPKALQGYGFRVDALERGLLARQQEVRRLKARAAAAAAAAEQPQQAQRPVTPSKGEQGTSSSTGKKGGKRVGGGVAITEDEPKLDRDSQERVKKEQAAQQALKGQLEELVGALKASTLLVHSSLREQNKVLDKTEDAAQRNLEGLQAELRKTEEQLRRSWSNSLTSCVMIFLMLAIFLTTFLFMRLFPKRRWLLW